ncbi:phosphoglycerate dehydrogenase [Streptantibioticus cattleyicolor]|uniref:Phosphoglycerate dehydrogenase n=1 Tax=Streptantibioticus cattleyicolor (strain ATCC 35852 / DSM 46488 / JCM 4925 / NBRC 14057 / NRRL 8057) TaxID=1003195 RepID=F8JLI9_STREN|nr:phosphoglycerate dehydrogenase [Streptantibioticus cattleyicolor]AEW98296.1 Phosphoglycerate dehydrogenase [Streptantibioticus cattleyicolor NRRL 8057 = DSM 46488]CCB72645.1 Lactate dehydrogenase-like oxidoreductase [Streptantibioticus cattleyicolor NRRL 8057 = DSM 46488]
MTDTQHVLVTTTWLRPGDEVHRYLLDAGFSVAHGSSRDREAVAGCDAVIAGTDRFDAEVLAGAPQLRVICRTGAGYDNVDVEAATARGVAVCTTPGVNGQSVAEHTIGLLLSAARAIPQNVAAVRAGRWEQGGGRELAGAVLGVVGFGAIGRRVAAMARGIGMDVVAHDPVADRGFAEANGVRLLSLEQLLASSDVVTLHLSLTPSTRHLIDAGAFARMKPGAYLVNAARGGIVDEEALADALASGRLAGAALDTVETEPLPSGHRLRAFDNVLVTAHIGAATRESRARSGMLAARSVVEVLAGGIPGTVVNPGFAGHRTSVERGKTA